MLNMCILMGRLTNAPEIKQLESGTKVMRFCIAVNRPKAKKEEEVKTDFIDCIAWGKTAEFIEKYFEKGNGILVKGSIETQMYQDKNGNNRKSVNVLVREVDFCIQNKNEKQETQSNTKNEEINDLPF